MTIERIYPRRGTAAAWTSANPILGLGELGYETDTKRQKRGDGTTAWTSLTYISEWSTLPGKPAVVAAGADTASARTAIGVAEAYLTFPDQVNGPPVLPDNPMAVFDRGTSRLQAAGVATDVATGWSGAKFTYRPAATGWAGVNAVRPIHLDALIISTDQALDGSAQPNSYQGLTSSTVAGDSTHAMIGTVHAISGSTIIKNTGSAKNEPCTYFGYLRDDSAAQAGSVGSRMWFTDFNMHGPIGIQSDAFSGLSMFVNNYYNGSPATNTKGGAIWASTKAGTGGGASSAHTAAQTYPTAVGIGIVGTSGTPDGVTVTPGFTTALQIGGNGSNWPVTASKFTNGINVKDYTNFGILINGRYAGATGPAIAVDVGCGPVVVGATAPQGTTTLFEVITNGSADPVTQFRGLNTSDSVAVGVGNASGLAKFFIAGVTDAFLIATAAGDQGIRTGITGKSFHIGGTTKVVSVSNANGLGFFGVTPITQPARAGQLTDSSTGTSGGSTIAAVSDITTAKNAIATLAAKVNALETILHNFGLTA